jgi:hypothetical protein
MEIGGRIEEHSSLARSESKNRSDAKVPATAGAHSMTPGLVWRVKHSTAAEPTHNMRTTALTTSSNKL